MLPTDTKKLSTLTLSVWDDDRPSGPGSVMASTPTPGDLKHQWVRDDAYGKWDHSHRGSQA